LFELGTGNVAKPVRMALGSPLIKQETGLSDDGVVQNVVHDPIYNNIRIGNMDATREEVLAAAKAACCDELVNKLPE